MDFNPRLKSTARNAGLRKYLRVAESDYSGVGDGDGELGCVSDDSPLGDAVALIFIFRSSSRRRNRSARSAVAVSFSAVPGSDNER
jgi:hypothetical protein